MPATSCKPSRWLEIAFGRAAFETGEAYSRALNARSHGSSYETAWTVRRKRYVVRTDSTQSTRSDQGAECQRCGVQPTLSLSRSQVGPGQPPFAMGSFQDR